VRRFNRHPNQASHLELRSVSDIRERRFKEDALTPVEQQRRHRLQTNLCSV
jgi:hypothetical protein